MEKLRKCLSVISILVGGTAVVMPDFPEFPLAKVMIAFSTSCNAAALWLLKDAEDLIIND